VTDVSRAIQEPWPDLRLQREAVGLGMWFFLASEVLFFAALFCSYAVYRSFNEEAFRHAAAHTKLIYGSINTVLLLTSSLTMTVALRAATARLGRMTLICLGVTAALGIAFLVTKGLEYYGDIKEHLIPGSAFPLKPAAAEIFWGLYWVMTGIHAIHLTAGIGIVVVVMVLFRRGVVPVQGSTMEGVAIYWHFVDTVWLFLFPVIYLGGRT
jgi:cytochrome c oxidase subunit III